MREKRLDDWQCLIGRQTLGGRGKLASRFHVRLGSRNSANRLAIAVDADFSSPMNGDGPPTTSAHPNRQEPSRAVSSFQPPRSVNGPKRFQREGSIACKSILLDSSKRSFGLCGRARSHCAIRRFHSFLSLREHNEFLVRRRIAGLLPLGIPLRASGEPGPRGGIDLALVISIVVDVVVIPGRPRKRRRTAHS